ncbi:Transcriptional regulator, LysR family (modular protein) [Paraburkholderia piptadeniae]|uniref:LysR family transcriptional regulator n=2 Tax=Paraburkholderia TaxID=1822464 RepID=A0A7X1NED2_9BURK|nr:MULTISPECIES: LysR family transcriptional regulator [Paraburkholderia]MPW20422.1 LysR family transcriptional regulator [Paraburkholderia franconis]SIT50941.1 Transcriptional regulator, LysR family (modular protein) [Paraburkholderia piptadeniae]
MLPDLVSLSLFLRTIDSGSLSKAAEQSHIALSAASRRIALLEQQFSVKLLVRTPRGTEPTPAGEALAFHARLMLREADRLKTDLSDYAKGLRGIVRIHANTSALSQYLPYGLASFAKKCPEIKVEVQERLSIEIMRDLHEGAVDVGVAFPGRHAVDGLRCYPYKVDRLVAVFPGSRDTKAKDLRLADLLDDDLVVLESNTAMLTLLEEAATIEGKALRLRVQVKSFEAICRMIEAGMGVGILPQIAAQTFGQGLNLTLIPLSDDWAVRQMFVCVKDEPLSLSVQRLVDHLLIDESDPSVAAPGR